MVNYLFSPSKPLIHYHHHHTPSHEKPVNTARVYAAFLRGGGGVLIVAFVITCFTHFGQACLTYVAKMTA